MTSDNPERLLTVRELAGYLQMNERTVLKLATAGSLPGARIGNQWRFKREVIDEWLAEQMGHEGADQGELVSIPDGMGMPLGEILTDGSVIPEMNARDALGAIESLVAQAFTMNWLNDKEWFIGAIVEREALASTAMEGGVAFLHTRQRNSRKINRPFVIVGRNHQGIDFGAPDGKPTYVFFLLGLKHDKLHLPILGRLARVLTRKEVVRTIRAAPTPTRIRDTLLQEDARALKASPPQPVAKKAAAKKTKKKS